MRLLHQAARLAASCKENNKNFYLGCIAVRADGAVVRSRNSASTRHKAPSAHAEARALRKTDWGSSIWVARVLKDGKTWACARPCATCRTLILNKGIKKVYYTIGPNEWGLWEPEKDQEPK